MISSYRLVWIDVWASPSYRLDLVDVEDPFLSLRKSGLYLEKFIILIKIFSWTQSVYISCASIVEKTHEPQWFSGHGPKREREISDIKIK